MQYISTDKERQVTSFAIALCMTECYCIGCSDDITSTGCEILYNWHKIIVCGFQWLLIIVQNTLYSSMVLMMTSEKDRQKRND